MEQRTRKKQSVLFKVLCVILAILLMIGIAFIVAKIVHKTGGATVEHGLSAYELAEKYGYEGSLQEWLESLNGKSAYEIAKENGYTGTESDWADALNAAAQNEVVTIRSASFSTEGELLITLSDGTVLNAGVAVGKNGVDGKNGQNGRDGQNGKDGVGVSGASVNSEGQLLLGFS